jgi:hypothetical protein
MYTDLESTTYTRRVEKKQLHPSKLPGKTKANLMSQQPNQQIWPHRRPGRSNSPHFLNTPLAQRINAHARTPKRILATRLRLRAC